ncbi:phosphoheptose isomerase [Candidatus Saccharibacteria bacterium]|nr:phosphoheptose isomerase [Candidatus Saccharibacteria bacterium]
MLDLFNKLTNINISGTVKKQDIVKDISGCIAESGYTVTELNDEKPWGAYYRFGDGDEERFLDEFFPGLGLENGVMGEESCGLSLKILLVSPGSQSLSWQYHNRRKEVWAYITEGGYRRSMSDEESELFTAISGDVIQFEPQERHRLVGNSTQYTIVAEVWQHTDPNRLSDEDDIVRVKDDYNRE